MSSGTDERRTLDGTPVERRGSVDCSRPYVRCVTCVSTHAGDRDHLRQHEGSRGL